MIKDFQPLIIFLLGTTLTFGGFLINQHIKIVKLQDSLKNEKDDKLKIEKKIDEILRSLDRFNANLSQISERTNTGFNSLSERVVRVEEKINSFLSGKG